MARKQLILLLREHGVDLPRRSPRCRAVFLTVPFPAALGFHQGHSRDIARKAYEDGHEAVICPSDDERVRHRLCQVVDQVDQPTAQRLGEEQSEPNHRENEKQAEPVPACLGLLQSYHLRFFCVSTKKRRSRSESGMAPPQGCYSQLNVMMSY